MAVDDSYTKSLLHFNGVDGSQVIVDESGKTWNVVNHAQLDNAQKVFGATSLYCDGDDYITSPAHADWVLGSGDFTIDFRFRSTQIQGGTYLVELWKDNSNRFELYYNFQLTFYEPAQGLTIYGPSLSSNTWYHLALVRCGNVFKWYVDGHNDPAWTQIKAVTLIDYGSTLRLGYAGAYLKGWMEEFRWSKGIARWTKDFTPPPSEYSARTWGHRKRIKIDHTKVAPKNYACGLMTTNAVPSPFAASANSEFGGMEAYHAFGISGSWTTNLGAIPAWLKIDRGAGNAVQPTSYSLTGQGVGFTNRNPRNWTFDGSNNNVDWDVLDTRTGVTFAAAETKEFSCTAATGYRYFRVSISAVDGGTYAAIQRCKIFSSASTKTHFPVLVSGVYSYLATTANGGDVESASGHDIAFYADEALTTPLGHEVLSWSPTTGQLAAWVKVPSLSEGTDTEIYLAYGDPSVSWPMENKGWTWDRNFLGVFHHNDNAANTTVRDSTVMSANGTHSANTSANSVAGKIDRALDLTDDQTTIADNAYWEPSAAYSMECWVKPHSATQSGFVGKDYVTPRAAPWVSYGVAFLTGNYYAEANVSGTLRQVLSGAPGPQQDVWDHIVGFYTGVDLVVMVNGVVKALGAWAGTLSYSNAPLVLGDDCAGTSQFNGLLEEVRISSVARDMDWFTTCYTNQNDPATFYSIEDLSLSISPSGIASGEAFGTAKVSLTIATTGIASAEVLGDPTVTALPPQIVPAGIASEEAFGTHTVTAGIPVIPAGISSAEVFGSPNVIWDAEVVPSGIATAEALGTPALSLVLRPGSIASEEAFGAHTLTPGSVELVASGIAGGEAFGTAKVSLSIVAAGIASAEAPGSPQLNLRLSLTGILSGEAFGLAELVPGEVFLEPGSIASEEAFGLAELNIVGFFLGRPFQVEEVPAGRQMVIPDQSRDSVVVGEDAPTRLIVQF